MASHSEEPSGLGWPMLIKLFESSEDSRLVMDYAGIFSSSGLEKQTLYDE